MTSLSGFRRAALLVAFVMTASTVNAQVISTRPFRPLFRTTQDPAASKDRVDVSVFLSGGHDQSDTTFGLVGPAATEGVSGSSSYGHLFMFGEYAHDGAKTDFTATGSASTRYYSAVEGLSPMWMAASARLSGKLGRRGEYSLSENMSYSPYYVYSLAPGSLTELTADSPDTAPPGFDPDTDLRSTQRATYRYDTLGSYTHRMGRYTRAQVQYAFNYTDTAEPAFDTLYQRAGFRITHELGRYWNVYGGYGIRMSTYRDSPFDAVIVHDIQGGFGYSRALLSARTRVGFFMSTSLIANQSTQFRINGNAFISHLFSRSWMASAYYRRDNDVLYGFAAPFVTFIDSVGGMVAGKLPGPLYVTGGGTFSRGSYTALTVENVSNTSWAFTRVHVPLVWMLSVYGEGYYSNYDFERRIGLLPGVPTSSKRFGMRAGLMLWVPVLR